MRKTNILLIGIILLGIILRVIAAHHSGVDTDEMIYSIIPLNIIDANVIGTVEQSPLAFYLADIGYKLFGGITPISIRFFPIIFGAGMSLVIYLLSSHLFSRKSALLSSFLFAISGFALKFNYEMDMTAFFLAFLSVLFFIKYFKFNQKKYIYFSSVSLALGILIKNIVALFLLGFILYLIFNKSFKKIKWNEVFVALLLGVLIITPVFAYNYLTYSEKGITDYYFSNILGVGETVHKGMEAKPWTFSRFINITKDKFMNLLFFDFILLFSGIIGFIYYINKKTTLLLLLTILPLHIYLAGQTGSGSHYLFLPIFLSIFSGEGVYLIQKKWKKIVPLVLLLAIVLSIVSLNSIVQDREKSISLTLRDYVHEEIPEDAIVVIDPRIYRGIHAWVFNDKHYIEGTQFGELQQLNLAGPITSARLYYIECGEGSYCGWKPEDFERITPMGKQISTAFTQSTKLVKEIKSEHNYNIYEGTIQVPQGAYEVIDRNHIFWFYPIGWKYPELAVDYYKVSGIKGLIHAFGWAILWLDVLIVFGSIWLVWKEVEKGKPTESQ